MLYMKLHNSFSDFLVPDFLIMKKRTPCGIVRWELEAVQAQFTSDGFTRGVTWRWTANSRTLRGCCICIFAAATTGA
jgi:hypothetical protein